MKRTAMLVSTLAALAAPLPARAQTGADANAWAAWCRSQGGTVEITSSNPICHPGGGGGGGSGYTASQQAMLDVAGQLGQALGAAIRQSFVDAQRQAAAAEMRRRWEAEEARRQAAVELERQKQRNQALLANMRGAVGGSQLSMRGADPGGGLRMRTTADMDREAAARPAPAVVDVSSAYLDALQRRGVAQAAFDASSADLAAAERLVAEAERNARENPGPASAATLTRARGLRDQARAERDAAKAALDRAGAELSAAEAARTPAPAPHTDTSVVDLRGASSTPTLITALPQSLPRLQAVEDSPGRERWTQGMQAVIDGDWAKAADHFKQARALDPNNKALENAQALAEFTRDNSPNAAQRAQLRAPSDDDLKLLFFPDGAPAPGAVQAPQDDDLRFLFDRAEETLEDIYDKRMFDAVVRESTAVQAAANSQIMTDRLIEAVDPRAAFEVTARRRIADNLAAQALIRLGGGRDVPGAIALLGHAARQSPETPRFAAARDALVALELGVRTTARPGSQIQPAPQGGPKN